MLGARKEAVLKAMGEGIGSKLNQVVVPVGPIAGEISVAGWQLQDMPAGKGYAGAAAVRSTGLRWFVYWSYVV